MTEQAPEYCLFWIDHWALCMPRADWAAWVQAVGSVVAILVAVAVASQQYRSNLKTERGRDAGPIDALAYLLNECDRLVSSANAMMNDAVLAADRAAPDWAARGDAANDAVNGLAAIIENITVISLDPLKAHPAVIAGLVAAREALAPLNFHVTQGRIIGSRPLDADAVSRAHNGLRNTIDRLRSAAVDVRDGRG